MKRVYRVLVILGCIVMYVIAFGIGSFNETCPMWVNIPEYTSLIISVIIVIFNVMLWRGKKKNISVKIFMVAMSVVALITILKVNADTYCNPYWNSISWKKSENLKTRDRLEVVSYEEAKEDVDYAMKYLKKVHPALIEDVPQEIEQAYEEAISDLQMDGRINVETVQNAISSIYTKMNDGHTYTQTGSFTTLRSYLDENAGEFVQYSIDAENSLAILVLNRCIINKQYIKCVENMFKEVKEQNIHNIVVDLRNNGGGNSSVANEFIRYLDIDAYKEGICRQRRGMFFVTYGDEDIINDKYEDLLFKGDLYILSSNATCSSAMHFTEYIQANNLGTIVGESPGDAPNYYTDCSAFLTPNCGIVLKVSTKQSYAIDKNLKEGLLQPDVMCNPDMALDKVKEIIKTNLNEYS